MIIEILNFFVELLPAISPYLPIPLAGIVTALVLVIKARNKAKTEAELALTEKAEIEKIAAETELKANSASKQAAYLEMLDMAGDVILDEVIAIDNKYDAYPQLKKYKSEEVRNKLKIWRIENGYSANDEISLTDETIDALVEKNISISKKINNRQGTV